MKKDATKKDATKKDATKKDATKIDATKKDATKKDATKKDATKKNVRKKYATKKNVRKKDATNKEAIAKQTGYHFSLQQSIVWCFHHCVFCGTSCDHRAPFFATLQIVVSLMVQSKDTHNLHIVHKIIQNSSQEQGKWSSFQPYA